MNRFSKFRKVQIFKLKKLPINEENRVEKVQRQVRMKGHPKIAEDKIKLNRVSFLVNKVMIFYHLFFLQKKIFFLQF